MSGQDPHYIARIGFIAEGSITGDHGPRRQRQITSNRHQNSAVPGADQRPAMRGGDSAQVILVGHRLHRLLGNG